MSLRGGEDILSAGVPTFSEVWPYGIRRAGMSLEEFAATVRSIWTDYWVERRGKFVRYPISVFDRYLEELGTEGYHENVIFTSDGVFDKKNIAASTLIESKA